MIKNIEGAENSTTLLTYSVLDKKPYLGTSYYRLKQIDIDGQFSYSPVRSISLKAPQKTKVLVYPNPATEIVNIRGVALKDLEVYDVLGQNVTRLVSKSLMDDNTVLIDISSLNSGIYYIKSQKHFNKLYKQ